SCSGSRPAGDRSTPDGSVPDEVRHRGRWRRRAARGVPPVLRLAPRPIGGGPMELGKEISTGVRVFRAADAPRLGETDATSNDFEAAPEVRDVALRLATADCSINRILARSPMEDGGLTVLYLYFKPNFALFPHKHDVNSMYVVISGSI